jgi:hypothetical protein
MDEMHDPDGVSRRNLLLGLGAAGGAAAALGGLAGLGGVASALPFAPQAVGAPIAGLSYLGIDAFAFLDDDGERIYQTSTGTQPVTANRRISAPLPLPVGSVVMQISASYQQQPIIQISKRPLFSEVAATLPEDKFQKSFTHSPGGPFASTEPVDPPVTIEADATYTINAFCGPGTSIFGMSIGYASGFVPFNGAKPRVIDTRDTGQRLGKDQELAVGLGMPGRAAVFNLTAVNTGGPGFLAAFPANIAWPENSSVNFTFAGAIVANLVICAMDSGGSVKIRAGATSSDFIIDRIGSII